LRLLLFGLSFDFFGFVLFFFVLFFVFFRVFKIFFAPLVAADSGLVDGIAVDDYVSYTTGFEGDLAQVERGGLQGVEKQVGDLGIHLPAAQKAHDLHDET
jgi:hypothetical protein